MFEEEATADAAGRARWAWDWELRDRVAIVTGATSGIGVAIADAFAKAGASLVLVGRDEQRLARTAALPALAAGDPLTLAADLTQEDAPRRIVEAAVERFGRVDVLVHNAGIFHRGECVEADLADLDAQYAVHLRAPFALTAAAAPHMPEGGAVTFIGSNLADAGMVAAAGYAAVKGGAHSLARTLAVELAPHRIRVNTVAPGTVQTPMTAGLEEDAAAREVHLSKSLVGRLGTIEDVAAATLFLSSPAAGYVSGAVLTVDGGQTASW